MGGAGRVRPDDQKLSIYPGSLTTLADGRIVHAWNTWYQPEKGEKSRFVQFSISADDGIPGRSRRACRRTRTAESVIRHPYRRTLGSEWLFPLMDRTLIYNPKTGDVKPFGDGRNHGLVPSSGRRKEPS